MLQKRYNDEVLDTFPRQQSRMRDKVMFNFHMDLFHFVL